MPNPVRSTMADLITRLRRLISDPAGSNQVWQDTDIQDALDTHRVEIRYEALNPVYTFPPGGQLNSTAYKDYFHPLRDWEADEKLYDASYNLLTPNSSDELVAHWTFSAGQLPPVLIVGKAYDLYASAADVLEEWAAKEKLNFDFKTDGQEFRESQKADALLTLAKKYRMKERARTGRIVQTEFAGEYGLGVTDLNALRY